MCYFKACVSLLVFCLDDLSTDESRVLSPPLLLGYSQFLLLCLFTFALHTEVLYVGCIYIYNYIFLDWSLDRFVMPFFVS